MALATTTLTLELHLTTRTGGPVVIGSGEVDVPLSAESVEQGVRVVVDEPVLRHEIAVALMDLARQIEHPDPARVWTGGEGRSDFTDHPETEHLPRGRFLSPRVRL